MLLQLNLAAGPAMGLASLAVGHDDGTVAAALAAQPGLLVVHLEEARLAADLDLLRHEDAAELVAQHGPEYGHARAHGRGVHLEHGEQHRDGAVPGRVTRRHRSGLVFEDGLEAPDCESNDTMSKAVLVRYSTSTRLVVYGI